MRYIIFLLFPMMVFVSCANKYNYTYELFSTQLQCNDSIITISMQWLNNRRTPMIGEIVVEVSDTVGLISIGKYVFFQEDDQIILSSESEDNICMLNLTPYSKDTIKISNNIAPIFYVKSDSIVLYKMEP